MALDQSVPVVSVRRTASSSIRLPLPKPDAHGNYPAVEYARASLARNIIRRRVKAGLSQSELAKLAGIRNETLCRIERGQHTPSVATVIRIERAMKQATGTKRNGRRP